MLAVLLIACSSFAVIPYDPDWSFAAAGPFDACGWRSDGYLACSQSFTESPILPGFEEGFRGDGYAGVAVAFDAACTLRLGAGLETGYPACFGADDHPLVLDDPAASVTEALLPESLVAGEGHACGLTEGGAAMCWGHDSVGQSSPPDGTFVALAAGVDHTCGLDTDGVPTCWGGDLDAPPDYIIDGAPGVAEVAAGDGITCTLTGDADLWCSRDPRDEDSNSEWSDGLGSGVFHDLQVGNIGLCALDSDDRIVCALDSDTRTLPSESFRSISLSSKRGFGCGVTEDGDLSCFGGDDAPPLEDWNN